MSLSAPFWQRLSKPRAFPPMWQSKLQSFRESALRVGNSNYSHSREGGNPRRKPSGTGGTWLDSRLRGNDYVRDKISNTAVAAIAVESFF